MENLKKLSIKKLKQILDNIYNTVRAKNYSNQIACVCQAFGTKYPPSKCGGQCSYVYEEGGFKFILTRHPNPRCEPTVGVEDEYGKRYYFVRENKGQFVNEPETPQYVKGDWEEILSKKFFAAIEFLTTNSWADYNEKERLIEEIEKLNCSDEFV